MQPIVILFAELLASTLLVELSFWGLINTQKNSYLFALVLCTAAMIYVSYNLYLMKFCRPAEIQKEYSFYYIMDHPPADDMFDRNIKKRM